MQNDLSTLLKKSQAGNAGTFSDQDYSSGTSGLQPSSGGFGDIADYFWHSTQPDSAPSAPGSFALLTDDGLTPMSFAGGGGGGGGTSLSGALGAAPASTLVGSSSGLKINLVWDTTVNAAPAAFKAAVVAAAQFYTSTYENNVTINISVGYGKVAGTSLPSGALAASESYGYLESYATVVAGLKKDAGFSAVQATADASLSSTDVTKGGKFFVSTAEAKALGQVSGSTTSLDGYIGINSSYSFDYVAGTVPKAGQYDAIGTIEHEISEVMGRMGSLGSLFGSNVYTPLDLFRYSAPNTRDLTAGAGYFSINNGATNLGTYNNPLHGGDAADWTPSLAGNSYGSGYSGMNSLVTSNDIIENAALGWRMTNAGLAAAKTTGIA